MLCVIRLFYLLAIVSLAWPIDPVINR